MPLLDKIVAHAESYAQSLERGWKTDLYSLTKQDLALLEIPGMRKKVQPIFSHLKKSILSLYGARAIQVDRNQPHILKYSFASGHTGGRKKGMFSLEFVFCGDSNSSALRLLLPVELHHDRCDVTANLVLSRSTTYKGGG
jgi:hypothetical protein